jgi:hypothetical protein
MGIGVIRLLKVELGESEVGGKTFSTMKYEMVFPPVTTHATEFLYFPQPSDNEHFLSRLFCDGASECSSDFSRD